MKATAAFSLVRIESFIQPELLHITVGFAAVSWIVYRLLLKNILPERHRNLRRLFKNLLVHLLIFLCLFAAYSAVKGVIDAHKSVERVAVYLGFLTLFWALIAVVKSTRILLFEYLFLSHMRVGVPVLIVNIYTLLFSFALVFWVTTDVFEMRLTPLLATSAFLSLVVGLALQDTLGNLFAGVSLQFDKPYEIGDWIEIQNGTQKYTGEVREISWRATLMMGFAEELITVPNRVVTQSEISNWAGKVGPVIRSQILRMPYGVDIAKAKEAMVLAAKDIPGVRAYPSPLALIMETTESWLTFKLVYFVDNFGRQYIIGDKVITNVIFELSKVGIDFASQKILIESPKPTI